jgi:peroxiredoxin
MSWERARDEFRGAAAGGGTGSGAARSRALGRFRPGVVVALAGLLFAAGCPRDARVAEEVAALPEGTGIGERAPALSGRTADGGDYQYRPDGRNATVLVFYRSFDCGLCRQRLRELQAHLTEYEATRARVVAVSPDSAAYVRRAAEELGLTFAVVAADSAALREWDVLGSDQILPLPASYLVDAHGVVVFRHVGSNAADRASDLEILAALHNLRAAN